MQGEAPGGQGVRHRLPQAVLRGPGQGQGLLHGDLPLLFPVVDPGVQVPVGAVAGEGVLQQGDVQIPVCGDGVGGDLAPGGPVQSVVVDIALIDRLPLQQGGVDGLGGLAAVPGDLGDLQDGAPVVVVLGVHDDMGLGLCRRGGGLGGGGAGRQGQEDAEGGEEICRSHEEAPFTVWALVRAASRMTWP